MESITINQIFKLLMKRLTLLIVVTLAGMLIAGFYTKVIAKPYYISTSWVYVDIQTGEDTPSSSAQLTAAQAHAVNFKSFTDTKYAREKVMETLGIDELNGYSVTVDTEGTTQLKISITGPNANVAYAVCHVMTDVIIEMAKEFANVEVTLIDDAEQPERPAGPSLIKNVAIGGIGCLVVAAAIIIAMEMLDTKIKSAADAEEKLGIPVLAKVPLKKDKNGGLIKK